MEIRAMTSPAVNSSVGSTYRHVSIAESTQVVDLTLFNPFYSRPHSSSQPPAACPQSFQPDNLSTQVPDLSLFIAFYRGTVSSQFAISLVEQSLSQTNASLQKNTLRTGHRSNQFRQKTPVIPLIPGNSTCLHFTIGSRKCLISRFFTPNRRRYNTSTCFRRSRCGSVLSQHFIAKGPSFRCKTFFFTYSQGGVIPLSSLKTRRRQ
jgi:hypothetical protein